jgi:hypothetical protein
MTPKKLFVTLLLSSSLAGQVLAQEQHIYFQEWSCDDGTQPSYLSVSPGHLGLKATLETQVEYVAGYLNGNFHHMETWNTPGNYVANFYNVPQGNPNHDIGLEAMWIDESDIDPVHFENIYMIGLVPWTNAPNVEVELDPTSSIDTMRFNTRVGNYMVPTGPGSGSCIEHSFVLRQEVLNDSHETVLDSIIDLVFYCPPMATYSLVVPYNGPPRTFCTRTTLLRIDRSLNGQDFDTTVIASENNFVEVCQTLGEISTALEQTAPPEDVVRLSPNPCRDTFTITGGRSYEVHSLDGKLITSGSILNSPMVKAPERSGIYMVTITTEDGHQVTKRLVRQ